MKAGGTLEQADKVAREYVSSGLSPRLVQQFPAPPAILWSRGNSDDIVEQACNIFYILHWILYFLPLVRGEGTCGGGREERSVNHIA